MVIDLEELASVCYTFILTSFSKKPERSKHEDIPINWKALMGVGEPGLLSASDDYNKTVVSLVMEIPTMVDKGEFPELLPLLALRRLHCQ